MDYLKPQSPLYHKAEDAYFYPLTTIDQVIVEDGKRLNSYALLGIDNDGEINSGEPNPVNADTLGGVLASEYATVSNVNQQVRKAAPRNLLDNSDFRNPVNQRGKNVYSDAGYTIDRWKSDIGGIDISVEDGCVSLFSSGAYNFTQRVGDYKSLKGKTATFALRHGGDIALVIGYYANGAMQYKNAESVNGLAIGTVIIPDNAESITFFIQTKASIKASLYWAALYEGEYTAETLPEYQPKGYAAELAECQRYLIAYNFVEVLLNARVFSSTPKYADITLPTPGILRTNPTVINSPNYCAVLVSNTGWEGKIISASASANMVNLVFETNDGTDMIASTIGICRMVGNLMLSADL